MHILITAATASELLPAREIGEALRYQRSRFCIKTVETGIGSTATAYHTLKALLTTSDEPFVLAINIGIAGSYCRSLPIGSVVRVVSDYFGECGIQTASGFQSLFDAKLLNADKFPFISGKLTPPPLPTEWESALNFVPTANGVTVQHVVEKGVSTPYPAPLSGVETMEGAAFFYVCMNERIPCTALRAVSNITGERDKEKWDIPLALNELKNVLFRLLSIL